MKHKSIDSEIWRLAIPATLGNLSIPLLGLSDTAISGHLGSPDYLAAIAAGGMMLNVVIWLCGFLRMATAGITATAFGARDRQQQLLSLSRSMFIALLIGCCVIAFHSPLTKLFLLLISPSAKVTPLAANYFMVCSLGLPAQLMTMSATGWMIGMQNTMRQMTVAITVNLLNIALSLAAVFGFEMGFIGVAIGTATANWLGLIVVFILLRRFDINYNEFKFASIFRGTGFRKFFSMSTELFVRSACIMGVSMTVTAVGSRLGDLTMAANLLLMQFFIFFSYFMDGLAYAAEAICGRYAGARNREAFGCALRALLRWSFATALVFTCAYLLGFDHILRLLSDSPQIVATAIQMKPAIVALPLVAAAAFIFDGVYVGLTSTRQMMITTLAGTALFALTLLLSTLGLGIELSNALLWTAFLSYLAMRGLGLILQYPALIRTRLPKTQ